MTRGEKESVEDILKRKLYERRNILIDYLTMKAQAEDWHGVADAAMDIREIEAKLEVLE